MRYEFLKIYMLTWVYVCRKRWRHKVKIEGYIL